MSFVYDLYVDNKLNVAGNATIDGDLFVHGTTTSVNTENLNVKDRHVYLNDGYTTVAGKTGGLVVNYLPTATTDTVAGAGFTAATTVATTGAAVFAAGDMVQVSSSTPETYTGEKVNFGIYEVVSHAANVLTITASSDFAQTSFTVDTTTGANITKINVSIMQTSATGDWQTTSGATSTDLATNLKTILRSGGATSNATLNLTADANQISFDHSEAGGGSNTSIISSVSPTEASATYTLLDLGAGVTAANFVMSEGAQTLNGDYTIGSTTGSLIFEDSDQSHSYTIAAGGLTANSTYTLPSLDGAHTFVVSNDTTGQLSQADGLVDGPTYSFANDPDSGMYYDGTDSVNIAFGGSDILEVTAGGIIVNGSITSTSASIESVKVWTGAGAHAITLTGAGSEPVHTVEHTTVASITLPSVAVAQNGIKFTIYSFLDSDADLTINTSDADIFDNGTGTISFKRTNQHATFQYIDAETKWIIV